MLGVVYANEGDFKHRAMVVWARIKDRYLDDKK